MELQWFAGTLVEASAQAKLQNSVLVACIVDSVDDKNALTTLLSLPKVISTITAHCLCLLLEAGCDQACTFAKLFPFDVTPTIYLIHTSGNTKLVGDNIAEQELLDQIQARLDATSCLNPLAVPHAQPAHATHNGMHNDAHEAERYRRKLVKWRREDAQRLGRLREDLREDRKTYDMLHGRTAPAARPSVAPTNPRPSNVVRLQLRASNGHTTSSDFACDTLFAKVREFAETEFNMPAGQTQIAISFPQPRVFDASSDSMSLKQLELVGSATLFVRVWDRAPACTKAQSGGQRAKPAMTFGSELKPNEFGAVNGYVERQLDIYSGLTKLLAEKAAAEKEYGRKVLELARSFQEQLGSVFEPKQGASADSLALTDAEATESTALELLPAANEWALRLEEEGRLHVQLGSKIGGDIGEELRKGLDALSSSRKHTLEFYQKLLSERDRVFDAKDKARAQYEMRSKALSASQQRQERATSEKEQDKYRQKAGREVAQRNQAKNEYILQVAVANEVKRAVNHTFTPRVMDAMQTIDQQRVATAKRVLLQLLAMQAAAEERQIVGTKRAAHVVGRVAADVDSAAYVRARVDGGLSKWDEPPDFRVVVDAAAGEDERMALDGESQVILRNMCVHAQREGSRAEQNARTKAQEAEQNRQLQQASDEPGLEHVFACERESTLAELEAVQHQALRAAVEQQVGPVDQGTPHEFKSHTVAISKTCDYCGESIGGLNRKAARCGQCEYTCHAKCQIKVEPNCPGRDPDAKGGFLSLFGSKRGRRKSQLHRRSESVVSNDSLASYDSTHQPSPQPRSSILRRSQSRSRSRSSSISMAQQPVLPARPGQAAATMPRMSMPPPQMPQMAPTEPMPHMPPMSMTEPMPESSPHVPVSPGYGAASTMGRASTAPGSALAAAIAQHNKPTTTTGDGSVCTMLYDFEGDGSSTLSARAGDKVRVIEPESDGSGWTEVMLLKNNEQGMVPTSYVDMSEYSAASHAPSTHSVSTASLAPKQTAEYAVALYDFESRRPEELSCKQGDRVQIVSRDASEGWLLCKLDGREGLLPANYVE
ncbi:Protein BZZ1 [Coemansia erecta]|nr:Protein BZZ1 [Coemansia erecta]